MSVAVVTGASRGLGLAVTKELAERGWTVIVDARNGDVLRRAVETIEGEGQVIAVPGDVTDPAHREQIAAAVGRAGRVDLLVNNASVLGPSPQPTLDRYPTDELEHVFRVNTFAPLSLIQILLPALIAADGTVVNVTSDAAVEPYEGWGGYGSSKAGLEQLTKILGAEQPAVRVYAFDPGDMRTAMHQDAFPGEDISDRPEPESVVPSLVRLIEERPPSGRYTSSELAPVSGGVAR